MQAGSRTGGHEQERKPPNAWSDLLVHHAELTSHCRAAAAAGQAGSILLGGCSFRLLHSLATDGASELFCLVIECAAGLLFHVGL